jgi:hypothetical protein
MQLEELGTLFKRIEQETRTNPDPALCWQHVLDIAGQSSDPILAALDFPNEAEATTEQIRSIFAHEPLPSDVAFLYFGLYDRADSQDQFPSAGFYVAGGSGQDPSEALDSGNLTYVPKHRSLNSDILNRIRELAYQRPEMRQLLDYTILFGAAAILAKSVVANLGLRLPVYVGFDSGDYGLVIPKDSI